MKRNAVRELLKITSRPEVISFGGGMPAAELFPMDRVKEAILAVADRVGGKSLQYGETEGITELRDWIANKFSRPGCRLTRDNVLITSGGQQALDLLGRVLLNPGDRVAVENPTYLALLSSWRPLGPKFVPLLSDSEGICTDALPGNPDEAPKLLYLVPNFQNPQGTTLSQERRPKLVQWAREHNVIIIEDNPYGELRYSGTPLPHLFELDATQAPDGDIDTTVIYTGTFSKILMPGLRIGWALGPCKVIDKLVQAKQANDLHTSTLSQRLAFELISKGFLEEFIPVLRRNYRERRDRMLSALEQSMPPGVTWTTPDGGMFLLLTLPSGMDAAALFADSIKENVAFAPGEEFYLRGDGTNRLRLNFSNAKPEKIEHGIAVLGRLVRSRMR